MNNLGFREIFKFDAANLKVLNDTLRALWTKVMGRVEIKDLSGAARAVIDSKAESKTVDELKGTVTTYDTRIQQTEEAIRLKADSETVDALGRTVEGYSTQFDVMAREIETKVSREAFNEIGQTVENHSTVIKQTAEAILLKADKTYVDDQAADAATKAVSGTNLKITADEFKVRTPKAVFEILSEEGSEETVTQFDKNGITAAGEIIAPNLAYRYSGAATVTIRPDATGEEIAAGGVYRSLKEALAVMSNKNLPHDVVIDVQGDSYGFAELVGLCGSSHGLTINGNGHSLIGSFRAANCMTRLVVNGLTFAWNDVGGRDYAADFDNCADVELNGCTVDGSGGAKTGLYLEWATRATVRGCGFYRAYDSLMIAGNNVDLVMDGAKGEGAYFIWTDGANVKWRGTRPTGAWWRTLPSLITTDAGTTDLEALTPDDGTGVKPPETPTVMTAEFEMVHSDSYSRYLGWDWVYSTHPKDDDDIMQGYTETVSRVYGCMWFDLSAIRGRTVNQAMLRLHRMGGYGGSRAVEIHLYGTATAYDGRSGAPEMTVDYGVIGSAAPNETAMLTIPAQAAADLAGGAVKGLMVYTGETETYEGGLVSRNYARFAGETSGSETRPKPMLTVTYQ